MVRVVEQSSSNVGPTANSCTIMQYVEMSFSTSFSLPGLLTLELGSRDIASAAWWLNPGSSREAAGDTGSCGAADSPLYKHGINERSANRDECAVGTFCGKGWQAIAAGGGTCKNFRRSRAYRIAERDL